MVGTLFAGSEWEKTLEAWQNTAAKSLKDHPWEDQSSAEVIDDLRGGPVEPVAPK